MLARLKGKRGFTLVELMIVVAIIGVLAALAIYGVRRYVANAKSAEARMGIGRIAKDASSAWDKEGMAPSVMALGSSTGVNHSLCATITGQPTPATDKIKGMKYQSAPSEWKAWSCLGFSMNDPQYYSYSYTKSGTDGTDAQFVAKANGDLNGDGTLSTFTLTGSETKEGTSVTLVIAPNIAETLPTE